MSDKLTAIVAMLLAGCLTAGAQERSDLNDVSAQLEALRAIPDVSEQRPAMYEAARRWAETDPIAVHAVIEDQPRERFRDEIEGYLFTQWLAVDTASALRFIASLEEPPAYLMAASTVERNTGGWFPFSPDSDSLEILEIADELPVEVARSVRLRTVQRMARADPQLAAERIETFPPEERRQAGLNIARDYASVQPEGALVWARNLQEPDVEQAVIQGMVAADPFGMLARAVSGEEGITLSLVASGAFGSASLDKAQFGTALALLPRTRASESAVSHFTQNWLVQDQAAALEWIATSGLSLPSEAIHRAANRAGRDPEFAAEFAERLQGQNRSEWIRQVGSQHGREDPERMLEWLGQFRSDPAYPGVIADILPQLAAIDGPRAAALIQTLDGRERSGASWTVARQWANTDPVAAARWAERLPDDAVRVPSVRAAVDQWHSYDPAGAEAWVLGLAPGTLREESLLSLVTAVTRDGEIPSARVLDAFSTESARQNAILAAISMLVRRNRDGALELYEHQLTDPELRQRAEALFDPPPFEAGQRGGLFGPVRSPSSAN